jgi:hypothetical protein
MQKFKWNLNWDIEVFISDQDIPVTHNFKPVGTCRVEVIDKKFFIGHFDLTIDLKGNEYIISYFEMNTARGNQLSKIDFSDLYIPASPLMTVHEMINANGGKR